VENNLDLHSVDTDSVSSADSRQWAVIVGHGQQAVGQETLGSKQWVVAMDSGQWTVNRGQWAVISEHEQCS
jgi:hypothetical protein